MIRSIAAWLALSLLAVSVSAAEKKVENPKAPTITRIAPEGAAPGASVPLEISGGQLSDVTAIWTNLPDGKVTLPKSGTKEAGDGKRLIATLNVPADAAPGFYGLRVFSPGGVSATRLFMIDDLPTMRDNGKNQRPADAQELQLPVAVEGTAPAEGFDYFRIRANAGQRLSVEVVARRLGSPLDPVVRLLDSAGHELAYSDDAEGIGVDSWFVHKFKKDGDYLLEVRDIRYQGGSSHAYRLRVGDFPLVTAAWPPAAQRTIENKLALIGLSVEPAVTVAVTPSADPAATFAYVSSTYPKGRGMGLALVQVADGKEQLEKEPNDKPEQATPVQLFGAIGGRFDRDHDRDVYRLTAKKGQKWSFVGQTRRLGSPADLLLSVWDSAGKKLVEVDDSGVEEGTLNWSVPADGEYTLVVEDLLNRGGSNHIYRIEARPNDPGFTLAAEVEKLDIAAGQSATVKITAVRRSYDGPITLEVDGLPGAKLDAATIKDKAKDTTLKITLPADAKPGQPLVARIIGRAKIGEQEAQEVASTLVPLRTALAGLPYPPPNLDGWIGVGVQPAPPPAKKDDAKTAEKKK